ncbi:hypothetical protein [Labilibaculum euxinus]|uniref:DUF3137 domain-containing protein n=1 Tax=Labilibaculum euxinus TaxID=2686357 RepID=A0A7M4DBT0_9BACT|nr:hypothetical protein [Labilibaculum euxinus]MUP40109.1 hypothetical protein [Labilibaculum euxinus]MVB09314.1 hypothetical protein [Labilibaculum euxinus]
MAISYKTWQNHLIEFSKTIFDSSIEFKKNPSIGYGADFINGVITLKRYDNNIYISQSVITGNNEAELSSFILKFHYKNSSNLYINIYRWDFFDKLFSTGRIKSGNVFFDKIFVIKSNDKKLALKIFSSNEIQEIFLSNSLMTFNVNTKHDKTEVKIKHMQNKLYSFSEMKKALDNFCFILNLIQ